jgi:Ca2+-binding EF-hand superfamily protein
VASAFRELDKEQRGFIRPTDIGHFMREQDIDMSLEESGCAFRTMDLEGRGQVDLTAFHELIQLARLSPKKEELIDPCEVVPVRPK